MALAITSAWLRSQHTQDQVRIHVNPTTLASYGLNIEDLRSVVVAANVNQAKGNFDGPHQSYQIGANDQLLSSADYRPLVVAYRNGSPVKLTDVATVDDDAENIRQAAWMNDIPAVIVTPSSSRLDRKTSGIRQSNDGAAGSG